MAANEIIELKAVYRLKSFFGKRAPEVVWNNRAFGVYYLIIE